VQAADRDNPNVFDAHLCWSAGRVLCFVLLDHSGGRYGGGLTILEFFAEPCGAHMRLMRQCLDCQATLLGTLRTFQPTSCLTSMQSKRPTCQSIATVGLPTIR
jgi:hypothetical protein